MLETYDTKKKRPQKKISRHYLYDSWTGKPSTSALLITAPPFKDIKLGFETGVFDDDTFIIMVNGDRGNKTKMDKYARSIGKDRCHVHNGMLEDLNIGSINAPKVDFLFLDFCGHLNKSIIGWIQTQQKHFSSRALFAFTFNAIARQVKFVDALSAVFRKGRYNLAHCKAKFDSSLFMSNLHTGIWKSGGEEQNDKIVEQINVTYNIKMYCMSLKETLSSFKSKVETVWRYKEAGVAATMFIAIFSLHGKNKGKVSDFYSKIEAELDAIPVKQYGPRKKKRGRPKTTPIKKTNFDRISITSPEDLESPGKKAAITRRARKVAREYCEEHKEMDRIDDEVEKRIRWITASILRTFTRRDKAAG